MPNAPELIRIMDSLSEAFHRLGVIEETYSKVPRELETSRTQLGHAIWNLKKAAEACAFLDAAAEARGA